MALELRQAPRVAVDLFSGAGDGMRWACAAFAPSSASAGAPRGASGSRTSSVGSASRGADGEPVIAIRFTFAAWRTKI